MSLQVANKLFRVGKYKEALEIYLRLRGKSPALNFILDMNIQMSERRLYNYDGVSVLALENLYFSVKQYGVSRIVQHDTINEPLVSVIVTTHNSAGDLVKSINSLLCQSHSNLEIIIVDDCSSDDTVPIIHDLMCLTDKIKLLRLNCNLGTYFAKNYGIQESTGRYLFFHDSDDTCHPDRIKLMLHALQEKHVPIVNCEYARINEDESIVRVNGLISKLGRITLGFERRVVDEVGYFNCTTKASDDEFYQRLLSYYGSAAICHLKLPLYYAFFRENSLFSDMLQVMDKYNILQINSAQRQCYVDAFKQTHALLDKSNYAQVFYFPRIRDVIEVDSQLSLLCNSVIPVIVGIDASGVNDVVLEQTILSLIKQCDEVHLYNLANESTLLHCFVDKLVVFAVTEDLSARDLNVFWYLLQLSCANEACYYLNASASVIYPPDYVNVLIKQLLKEECNVVIRSSFKNPNHQHLTVNDFNYATHSAVYNSVGLSDLALLNQQENSLSQMPKNYEIEIVDVVFV